MAVRDAARQSRTRVPSPVSPAHDHWAGLDGLRAFAVIAVVIYHFSPGTLRGGFLGVDVFFVISGYLITRLLVTEYLADGRIDVRRFYTRRARRLLPALIVLLAVVGAAALIWRDQLNTVRSAVLSTAVFSSNWWLAFDHQSYFVASGRPSMLQHLWSLGVEEQFYLLWPLLVAATLAGSKRAFARRVAAGKNMAGVGQASISNRLRVVGRLTVLALVLSFASTGLMWALADRSNVPYGNDGSVLYYGTDTHCMGLLLGAALGAWAATNRPRPAGTAREVRSEVTGRATWTTIAWDAAGALTVVAMAWVALDLTAFSHLLYRGGFLLVSAIVCVAIASATRPGSRFGEALDWAPLRWVGVRSYSIYLWHWPIAVVTRPGLDTSLPVWLDQLLRTVLTVAVAAVTYQSVERPVRRLGFAQTGRIILARVRLGWRRLPPRAEVLGTFGGLGVAAVAVVVVIVGPAAPVPTAAVGAPKGGVHLTLPTHVVPSPKTHLASTRTLPEISAFGDSVLLGAKADLGKVFPGGTVDAVEGRQPDPILADVRKDAHAGTLKPLVVLHVGNNGLIDPDDLQRTLHVLRHQRLVLVLTDHLDPYTNSWQDPNNATIKRIVPEFPNARVLDWNHIVGSHPQWLYPDDLHLRPAGAVAFVRLLATAYRQWAAVCLNPGPNCPTFAPTPALTPSATPSVSPSTSPSPSPTPSADPSADPSSSTSG